jgi:hypothetical protein
MWSKGWHDKSRPITKVNKEMAIKRAYDFSFAVQADKKLTEASLEKRRRGNDLVVKVVR